MLHHPKIISGVPALVIAGALSASLVGALPSAQAAVIFIPGDNPQPDEEDVLFATPQTGKVLFGRTQSHFGLVFTSTQTLATGGLGQEFLEPAAPDTVITGSVTFQRLHFLL